MLSSSESARAWKNREFEQLISYVHTDTEATMASHLVKVTIIIDLLIHMNVNVLMPASNLA